MKRRGEDRDLGGRRALDLAVDGEDLWRARLDAHAARTPHDHTLVTHVRSVEDALQEFRHRQAPHWPHRDEVELAVTEAGLGRHLHARACMDRVAGDREEEGPLDDLVVNEQRRVVHGTPCDVDETRPRVARRAEPSPALGAPGDVGGHAVTDDVEGVVATSIGVVDAHDVQWLEVARDQPVDAAQRVVQSEVVSEGVPSAGRHERQASAGAFVVRHQAGDDLVQRAVTTDTDPRADVVSIAHDVDSMPGPLGLDDFHGPTRRRETLTRGLRSLAGATTSGLGIHEDDGPFAHVPIVQCPSRPPKPSIRRLARHPLSRWRLMLTPVFLQENAMSKVGQTVALIAALSLAPQLVAQGVESTATAPFANFESGGIRPLVLLPGSGRLAVVNTPDHRVEFYAAAVGQAQVTAPFRFLGEVFTGLEPVALEVSDGTLFVANTLSDTVAVVDLATQSVIATIEVGDEPRDLAIANGKLFVATSRSSAPSLVPGTPIDNALVVVDLAAPYDVLERIEIPGHMPRALEVFGDHVAVIPQNSGNETTILSLPEMQALNLQPLDLLGVDEAFEVNPALVSPGFNVGGFNTNIFGVNGWVIPETSRIVLDDEFPGRTVDLADDDLFLVNATTLQIDDTVQGIGTSLFDVVTNPATGDLWIANTNSNNRTRFEPRVRGATVSNRVTIVTAAGDVAEHIDLAPPLTTIQHAQPTAIAFYNGSDHTPLAYIGCAGSGTVVVLDALTGALVDELDVGLLPTGLAVDDDRSLLYVFTRIDDTIRAFDIANGHALAARPTPLSYDPEPEAVNIGREHLYSARSETGHGNGNTSCATCHISGHIDQQAWDLGDPEGGIGYFNPEIMTGSVSFGGQKVAQKKTSMIHPMKGPMTTQSLRGLGVDGSAPFHWRGDRPFFQHFQGAYVGLLDGGGISNADMQEFATFVDSLSYPPNPLQPKNREYVDDAANGAAIYGLVPGVAGKPYNQNFPGGTCNSCHTANFADGSDFDGSQPTVNFDAEPQLFNAAQLRGAYEKEFRHLTGFGTLHDGSLSGTFDFLTNPLIGGDPFPLLTIDERLDLEALVLQWDTGTAPAVGMQASSSTDVPNDVSGFLAFAESQAMEGHADLIGKLAVNAGVAAPVIGVHFAFDDQSSTWSYEADTGRRATQADVLAAIGQSIVDATFTLVPPGTGRRLGIDRDEDDLLDGIERALGTSPHSPDTDGDGFADGHEVVYGGHPRIANATLPGDVIAPELTTLEARAIATTTATLHVQADEAASLSIALGTSPGLDDLGTVTVAALRRVHAVVLDSLPPDTEVNVDVTASDRNGSASTTSTTFLTAPPEYSVGDLALDATLDGSTGEVTVTARVLLVDQDGTPLPEMPVRGLWAGEIGTADFFPILDSDVDGWATFTLGPFVATSGAEVTFSPAYIGTNTTGAKGFVGFGGNRPDFFYTQIRNAKNSLTIELP